mmetsp:Transcript_70568/g.106761  ORF Transcript_70568/g.106761 Transcript_70568/m.106761 type:complete len:454 (+) Transcript_70568:45-1406(+)
MSTQPKTAEPTERQPGGDLDGDDDCGCGVQNRKDNVEVVKAVPHFPSTESDDGAACTTANRATSRPTGSSTSISTSTSTRSTSCPVGNEKERRTTASLVHRRKADGSMWSATRLRLPDDVGTSLEIVHSLVLGEDTDPFFFNEDYSVAASTGLTKVWDGAWTVLNLLSLFLIQQRQQEVLAQNDDDQKWLLARDCLRPNSIIVELGSGSGLVGLVAACLGGHVLLTDVPTVVENALEPNIGRNSGALTLSATSSPAGTASSPWPDARSIGRGTVACAPFDWRRVQRCHSGADVEYENENAIPLSTPVNVILAVECLWLKDLLKPFVAASLALLSNPAAASMNTATTGSDHDDDSASTATMTPVMYMCSRERAKSDSQVFCSPQMAVDAFREAGCEVTLILEEDYPDLLPQEQQPQKQASSNNTKSVGSSEEIPPAGPVQLFRILPPMTKTKSL